jgi:hypothetical protein
VRRHPWACCGDRRSPPTPGAHDLLLVVGAAALLLGVTLVSLGGLPAESSSLSGLGEHTAPLPAASPAPAAEHRLLDATSREEEQMATPEACTAGSTSGTFVVACTGRNDPDQDPRLFLANGDSEAPANPVGQGADASLPNATALERSAPVDSAHVVPVPPASDPRAALESMALAAQHRGRLPGIDPSLIPAIIGHDDN